MVSHLTTEPPKCAMQRSLSAPECVDFLDHFQDSNSLGDMSVEPEDDFQKSKDAYQVFRINQNKCQRLLVTIVRGRGITRGKLKDWLYAPDPYVAVQVIGTPNGQKKTKFVTSCSDPLWNETLTFFIDSHRDRLIEFVLFDLNRTVNEEIGRDILDIVGLSVNKDHGREIAFKNGSKIEIRVKIEKNPDLDLRCGMGLSEAETKFCEQRKPQVWQGLKALLPTDREPELSEVPKVCLMTSGGGFRAMIAYAGVFKALSEAGVMDVVTYAAALSGSSWYLATLYTHPEYPEDRGVVSTIQSELRSCVEKHWQVHLSPPWSSRYLKKIIRKSVNGQPVSFTDFYGYLVGQQLLKGRMKTRLSDQRDKISSGQAPMPIYTCLHVKSNVSAKVFQEWYEFNPFEVVIPKYGISIGMEDFASKFYMGKIVKAFPEVPLHFLYGIWGSAFTILFKRLVQERGRNCQGELLKMISGQDLRTGNYLGPSEEEDLIVRCIAEECNEESDSDILDTQFNTRSETHTQMARFKNVQLGHEEILFDEGMKIDENDDELFGRMSSADELDDDCPSPHPKEDSKLTKSRDSGLSSETDAESLKELEDRTKSNKDTQTNKSLTKKTQALRQKFCKYSLPRMKKSKSESPKSSEPSPLELTPAESSLEIPTKKPNKTSPTPSERIQAIEEESSKWDRILERALSSTPIDSRAFRAGVILNPLRGITADKISTLESCQTSPVKPTDNSDCDFKGYRESMKTDEKKIYLVDSGLSFNLPFPLMLRPERGVQLYITIDFSSRKSDSTPPFREILLAEKWAQLHGLPFPPIREMVKMHLDQPIKECYVFKDTEDSQCPVIVFFPLVNANFRHFKAPGVARETDDEKAFGDFNIFDETNAYAIWRFVYPKLSYDRLVAMMEFNILNNLDIIKAEIGAVSSRH